MGKRMSEQAVIFNSGSLKLSGMYHEAQSPVAAAVICHPHPQFGGSMDNNVVNTVARTLQETGHSTLRFNFRGVGESEGSHDSGMGETEDVRAAIEFVREKAGRSTAIVLAGYSFGSWVAAAALEGDESVSHLMLIAPPTAMLDFSILTKDKKERARHVIVGERDQYCDYEALQKLFDSLPEPKTMKIVTGADHFWYGREKALAEAVGEALADHT